MHQHYHIFWLFYYVIVVHPSAVSSIRLGSILIFASCVTHRSPGNIPIVQYCSSPYFWQQEVWAVVLYLKNSLQIIDDMA